MILFYAHEVNAQEIILNEEESKHCTKVLRIKIGDIIFATDGKGNLFKAQVKFIEDRLLSASILEVKQKIDPKNQFTSIAIALPKNPARMEWFCEKATEIGVHQIFPITTARSEKKQLRTDRLQKIIIAAAKQSGKVHFPYLSPLTDFNTFLRSNASQFFVNKFIAWCSCPVHFHLKNKYTLYQPGIVLIGPEGDFKEEEIIEAKSFGFEEISLGESRFRIETAGIVACEIVNLLHEQ